MAKNTIYAYLIGNDFQEIADPIVEQINEFNGRHNWIYSKICAVNQQRNTEDGFLEW